MRASRLVSILLLLQNRERMTAQELADTLEVSVRTVYGQQAVRCAFNVLSRAGHLRRVRRGVVSSEGPATGTRWVFLIEASAPWPGHLPPWSALRAYDVTSGFLKRGTAPR